MIVDSQVHAHEANTPKRPWHIAPNWPEHVAGDEMWSQWTRSARRCDLAFETGKRLRRMPIYPVALKEPGPTQVAVGSRERNVWNPSRPPLSGRN